MMNIYDREPMLLFSEGRPDILPAMHQMYTIRPISSRRFLEELAAKIDAYLPDVEYIRTKDVILFREFDEEQVAHYFALSIELSIQVEELEE